MDKQVISILIHWPGGPEFTEYRHNIWVDSVEEGAKLVATLMELHEGLQLLHDAGSKEIRHLGVQANRERFRKSE